MGAPADVLSTRVRPADPSAPWRMGNYNEREQVVRVGFSLG